LSFSIAFFAFSGSIFANLSALASKWANRDLGSDAPFFFFGD